MAADSKWLHASSDVIVIGSTPPAGLHVLRKCTEDVAVVADETTSAELVTDTTLVEPD